MERAFEAGNNDPLAYVNIDYLNGIRREFGLNPKCVGVGDGMIKCRFRFYIDKMNLFKLVFVLAMIVPASMFLGFEHKAHFTAF